MGRCSDFSIKIPLTLGAEALRIIFAVLVGLYLRLVNDTVAKALGNLDFSNQIHIPKELTVEERSGVQITIRICRLPII